MSYSTFRKTSSLINRMSILFFLSTRVQIEFTTRCANWKTVIEPHPWYSTTILKFLFFLSNSRFPILWLSYIPPIVFYLSWEWDGSNYLLNKFTTELREFTEKSSTETLVTWENDLLHITDKWLKLPKSFIQSFES